ncbi:MAG: hypothetical protein MZV63_31095 [Marinilabiliales bacterium]|nr:hypothetical protein [Marinilabiliales bacterium]
MMLGGVKKEFRGKGIDVLMGVKILRDGINSRMENLDSHLVLEDNAQDEGRIRKDRLQGGQEIQDLSERSVKFGNSLRLPEVTNYRFRQVPGLR